MSTTHTAPARQTRGFIYNGTATLITPNNTEISVEALLQSVGKTRNDGRGRLIGPGPLGQYPSAGARVPLKLNGGRTVMITCSTPVRYRPPGFGTKYTGEAEMNFAFTLVDTHD